MRIRAPKDLRRLGEQAFTLVEASFASLLFGIMLTSLYGAFSAGFATIKSTREDLRATQIMLERMETIRLYRWEQITDPSYVPSTFTNYYYPDGVGSGAGGVVYTGSVRIVSMPLGIPSAYSNSMRQVSVKIGWLSGKRVRGLDITTFVAQHGLQNYVYNPPITQ